MKKILILASILICIVMISLNYYLVSQNNLIDVVEVTSVHIFQERIDGKNQGNEVPINVYADLEDENVQIFLRTINDTERSRERVSIEVLRQEYSTCEYFREIHIKLKEKESIFVYHGFSQNDNEKMPIYFVESRGVGYKISDDAAYEAMDNLVDAFAT